jgi:hypothetical protein
MPKVKVIAHVMHETERDLAETLVKAEQVTEAFVAGEIEESDISALEDQGIIVQRIEQTINSEFGTNLLRNTTRMLPKSLPPDSQVGKSTGYLESLASTATNKITSQRYYNITSFGPLLEVRKNQLQSLGADVIELLPDSSMVVRLPSETITAIESLPWVQSAIETTTEESLPLVDEVASARTGPSNAVGIVTYDILVHEEAAVSSVETWLVSKGVQIIGKGRTKIRIVVPDDSSIPTEVGALPEVFDVEPWIEPRLHNDRARVLMSVDIPAVPASAFPFDGTGELLAIADTGLDQLHPDFQGRINTAVGLGRPTIADDPHGHGTHVAGSALGDGMASGGVNKGVAPRSSLYFQSLLDSNGRLGGLPVDLKDLFDPPYQQGARVHNNSWGAFAQGSYRTSSREVDQFVHDHRDMVIVISAGNDGTAANPPTPLVRTAKNGFVNWCSIGAPASAKNCITVGASRSDRTAGGYSTLNYGQAWPNDFPDDPMKSELVSGNPAEIAGFSSRGPTDDYRIKPDVVAPGTDILSCKSSIAPLSNFAGPNINGGSPSYAFDCGTSMSAPLVAGCAILVRQYYRQERSHNPSAALVKATIVNGSQWLNGLSSKADHQLQPNLHQGFGSVNMRTTLPVSGSPAVPADPFHFDMLFVDNWNDPAQHFTLTGQRHRYGFTISAPAELRITLAYTDLPGRALQNNLNLFLQMLPFTTRKWIGNLQMPFSIGTPDTANNVEVIRIDAQPGDYLIQITAQNLPSKNPKQDYALVVTSTSAVSNWGPR